MTAIEELANATVLQGVRDYRAARKRLNEKPDDREATKRVRECERFFRSGWFSVLTDLDGRLILRKLKEEFAYDC